MLSIPKLIFQKSMPLRDKIKQINLWIRMRTEQTLLGSSTVTLDGLTFEIRKNYYQLTNYLFSGEDDLIPFLKRLVNENSLFIDIGANIGMISLAIASATSCTVIACEPVKSTFSGLSKNVSLNPELNIYPFNCALSECIKFLYITNLDSSGINHLKTTADPGTTNCLILSLDALYQLVTEISANLILLKIDTERHELDVLRGGRDKLLKLARPVAICFEYFSLENLNEIDGFLRELGFFPITVDQFGKIDRSISRNINSSNALYGNAYLLNSK